MTDYPTTPPASPKRCPDCGEEKALDQFYVAKARPDGRTLYCKDCSKARASRWHANNKERGRENALAWRHANPVYTLFSGAKHRAAAAGLPFDITQDDIVIPELCPVFKVPLERRLGTKRGGPGPCSPTLDRIVPERGYVRGNIVVVSHRANRAKNDLTLIQLRQLLDFYEPLLMPTRNPRRTT